jgi:hypothetical protein
MDDVDLSELCHESMAIVCPIDFAELLRESTEREAQLIAQEEEGGEEADPVAVHWDPAADVPIADAPRPSTFAQPTEADTPIADAPMPSTFAQTTEAPTSQQLPQKRRLTADHAKRKRKREAKTLAEGQVPRPSVVDQVIKNSAPIRVAYDFSTAPHTSGAYSAKNSKPENADKDYSAQELVDDYGFGYIPWEEG